VASLLGTHEIVHTFMYLAGFNVKTSYYTRKSRDFKKKRTFGDLTIKHGQDNTINEGFSLVG
jgi:hypothetical protein